MATISSTQPPATTLKWVPLPAPIQDPLPYPLTPRTICAVETPNAFPCRRCLQDGLPGEAMHLISYDPFPASAKSSPYAGPGPIFVHSHACAPYTGSELPEQQRRRLLSVRAYDGEHMMVSGSVLQGDGLVEKAVELLQDENVEYLHVHNAGAGCFAVRIERN